MLESSFQIARVAGIRIGVHYTWLIIFFLINSSLYFVFRAENHHWNQFAIIITSLVTSLLFFTSIVLHELGHSLVALRNGIKVHSITLFIFGGVAQTEREADRPMVEFKVAIAGPLVSLALAGLFWVLRDILGAREHDPVYVGFDWLASINLVVAIFNLVPGFPLDGGRVFRAIVWALTGDERKGMKWAVAGGRLVAYGLMLWGLLVSIQTRNLLSGFWLIGIGWFLLSAAEASGRAFTQGRVLKRLDLDALVQRDVPRVPGELSVQDWVAGYVLPKLQRVALVEQDGRIVGLVTLSDSGKLPEPDWSSAHVADIMTPIDKIKSVSVDSSLEDILVTMQNNGINQVPVVENGVITGWVDRESLLRALRIYTESRQI